MLDNFSSQENKEEQGFFNQNQHLKFQSMELFGK